MPAVAEPTFANNTFPITEYGAKGDGQTLNTEAFAKAIKACVQAGGGKVIVPVGLWLTGPIQLQSNINLHVERGAVILFTPDRMQYPMVKASAYSSRFAPASPIYGYELKNIAITGEGILDGSGESWRPVKKIKTTERQWDELVASGGVVSEDGKIWWPSSEAMNGSDYLKNLEKTSQKPTAEEYLRARDYLRPYMVYLVGCENVLIEHVTLRNSPKFVLYPNRCKNVTIRYANIYNDWWAQNGDGIDISACKQVFIFKCNVNVGDDGICMKSSLGGSEESGSVINLANVIIAECTVYHGHGGFVIGSNTDGGMQNIFVSNCSFLGTDIGIRVKSNAGSGGLVKDIFINDIYMANIKNAAISFNTYYENRPAGYKEDPTRKPAPKDKLPVFQDFQFNNIYCRGAHMAVSLTGLPESPIRNVFLNHVVISAEYGCIVTNSEEMHFKDVRILPSQDIVYSFNNARNINITKGYMPPDASVFVKAEGRQSAAIIISETTLPDSPYIIEITHDAPKDTVIRK
jgi:DNA sulfur modification protein DndE